MSLEEDAKNANKCGLTYGYYMPVKGKIKVPKNFKSYNDKQEEKKMAMGTPITEDQKENIIALHEKGLATSKIARKTGLSESSVRRTVRKNKELETVAPVSSPKKTEHIQNGSENIVAQKEENVKPQIPDSILKILSEKEESLWQTMTKLLDEYEYLEKQADEIRKFLKEIENAERN